MTEPTHPAQDDLVALAIGHLDGDRGAEVTDHLAACAGCRRDYDSYAASIALVVPAAPRTAPPANFEVTVLDRIRARQQRDGSRGTGARPVAAGGVQRRQRVLLVAAAVVLGLVLGAGAGAIAWRPGDEGERAPTATAAGQVPLATADGEGVGHVWRSYSADGPVLVLEVTDGPAGQSYTCRLVRADGSTEDVAHWELSDQRPNSWVIDPGGEVSQVQLIGEDGRIWSTAEL